MRQGIVRGIARFATVSLVFAAFAAGARVRPAEAQEQLDEAEPFGAPAAEEPQKAWWVALEATVNGKYIWRGQNIVDDHVFQPSATVGYKGLSVNVWGNRDLTDANDQAGNFTEIDYTIDYSWDWKGVGFSTGAIYYDFPHSSAPETVEVYGSAAFDAPLSPSVTLYWDVDEADGAYASFGLGHTFADLWRPGRGVSMSLDVGASLGFASANWNNFYFGVDKSAFTDGLLTVAFPFQIGERWSVTPALNYSALLDDDIRDTSSDQSNFWGGVTLSYSF